MSTHSPRTHTLGTHTLFTDTEGTRFYLSYVLRDGTDDKLEHGEIRATDNGVNVYGKDGKLKEELSGTKMRNWCVIGKNDQRVEGWYNVLNDDDSAYVFQPPYPHKGPEKP